ncbi:MAG: hypothetical protein HYT62_00515 [Candidatus Yanofskybacteria bacterium]|nr:hypothetical protein [Candidatus Yanofskybacteria bacterium]
MDFWQVHGWWFLIFITLFPRLTMLFAVMVPFGWLAWLGWVFTPSLLVAILATTYYWNTNPVLCVFAWLFAFGKFGGTAAKASSSRR